MSGEREGITRDVVVGMRVNSRNPGHTTVSVFTGRQVGSRGHSGVLTFRTEEWDELVATHADESRHSLTLRIDLLVPLAPVPPERRAIRGG